MFGAKKVPFAEVVELVDTLGSGSSEGFLVGVRLSPSAPYSLHAEVAQSVEQGTENPRVGSSILSLGTINFRGLRLISVSPFSL